MKRRTFLKNTSLATVGLSTFGIMNTLGKGYANNYKVNEQRIVNRIAELAKYGRDTN